MRNSPPQHGGIAVHPSQRFTGIGWRRPSASDLPPRPYRSSRLARIAEATLQGIGELVRRLIARSKRRQQARATYLALRELDARTLRDLGFDRSEILSVAHEIAGAADVTRVRCGHPGLPL